MNIKKYTNLNTNKKLFGAGLSGVEMLNRHSPLGGAAKKKTSTADSSGADTSVTGSSTSRGMEALNWYAQPPSGGATGKGDSGAAGSPLEVYGTGSAVLGKRRGYTADQGSQVVGPTQPEETDDPELDAYYASKMTPETDTEVTKKKDEVAYLSGESDKPPTGDTNQNSPLRFYDVSSPRRKSMNNSTDQNSSDSKITDPDKLRAHPFYDKALQLADAKLREYARAMQNPNLSDKQRQKITDAFNKEYMGAEYMYQLAMNDTLKKYGLMSADGDEDGTGDGKDDTTGGAGDDGADSAGGDDGAGDGSGEGEDGGTETVPSSDFAAGNIQDWYRHFFGGDFTGEMPGEKPGWMTDGDWLNGQNAYALYRKAQLEDESYNNRLANLESWYNAQISELSGASDAQKQKAAMLYNRLLKYLPVQNRAQGISNLGVAQSTGTRALATYMGRLGDIGSQEASSRASLAQSRQNSALSLEEAYGSAKKDRITAENNLLNSRYAQILQNQSDAEKNAAAAAQATSEQILDTLDSYIKQAPSPEALQAAMEAYLNSPYVDEETKRLIREKLQIYMSSYSEEHGDGGGDFSFD